MSIKKTTKKRNSVNPKKFFESKEALAAAQLYNLRAERDNLQKALEVIQKENHQLQESLDEARVRNDELVVRVSRDRSIIKDLEERLRRESIRSGQALDAFENVSVAVNSAGRMVHWFVDMAQDVDLVLTPREKK
jgi:chromosome segregation ATPase